MTDEQFAPGAAIDACEAAVKLNPDLARGWFELGRSYWIGQRDKEAFKTFVEAANRKYAPALKFIGDAYLEGRGLPSGERQSPQIAMTWYQKSADGGFQDGVTALREVQAAIKREEDDKAQQEAAENQKRTQQAIDAQKAKEAEERERFDPTVFQNKDMMSALYYNKNLTNNRQLLIYYLFGFITELGGDQILFIEPHCKPLVNRSTNMASYAAISNLSASLARDSMACTVPSGFGKSDPQACNRVSTIDQGSRDAVALVNRYTCQSEVAKTIMKNIDIMLGTRPQQLRQQPAPAENSDRPAPRINDNSESQNPSTKPRLDSKYWQVSGSCRDALARQQAKPKHGAFAVTKLANEGCGWSFGPESMETLRAKALASCANYGHDCRVVYEQ